MMKRHRFVIFALLFVLLAGSRAYGEARIKVGVSLPLSGFAARMGEALRRGFELYQKEYPQHLARAEVIFDDHRYDGKQTVSSFRHLVTVKGVNFFAAWGNTPAETLAPLAESAAVPALFMTHEPVAKDRKHVVAMGNRFEKAIQMVADFFKDAQSARPAALYVNLGNALHAVQTLKDKLGGNLLDLAVEPEVTFFQPLILRMKKAQIDGLLLFALPEQAMTFGRQAKALKFTPRIIGGDVFAEQSFLSEARPLFDSIEFVYGKVAGSFIERYFKEYSDISFFFEAACGYTLAAIIYNELGRPVSKPSNWLQALSGADLGGLPLMGLRLNETAEDGWRLENDSAIYSSKDLEKYALP